jgi:hypothetical protein
MTIGENLNKGGETPDLEGKDGREVKQGSTDEVIDVQINSPPARIHSLETRRTQRNSYLCFPAPQRKT